MLGRYTTSPGAGIDFTIALPRCCVRASAFRGGGDPQPQRLGGRERGEPG